MNNLPNIITIGIVFIYFVEKFFAYLKTRKNGNGKTDNKQDVRLAVIEEKVRAMESNHLPHITKRLTEIESKIGNIEISTAKLNEKVDILIKK